MEVVVLETGLANVASVTAGLRRQRVQPRLSTSAADVEKAEALVLPGVGAFGAGMRHLERHEIVAPLRERIADGRPTLAVCLGLQLLCRSSAESPDVDGLGVLPVDVSRFPDSVCVPQMGWNEVVADPACSLLATGHAYFANSYRVTAPPTGWAAAITDHGGPFVAAVERGTVLACQFHPELSGAWGACLLERWLTRARC